MLIHIIRCKNAEGENDILGVFTEAEYEMARIRLGEYAAENPDYECWMEQFDADKWIHETEQECQYKMYHRTMVSKSINMMSHVYFFTKEELPTIIDGEGWYIIQQEFLSFDEEEGKRKNLQMLQEYLKAE